MISPQVRVVVFFACLLNYVRCEAYDVTPIEVKVSEALESKMFELTKMLGRGVLVKLDPLRNNSLILVKPRGNRVFSKFLYDEAQGLRRYTDPKTLLTQALDLRNRLSSRRNQTWVSTTRVPIQLGPKPVLEELEVGWNTGKELQKQIQKAQIDEPVQLLQRRRPYVPLRDYFKDGRFEGPSHMRHTAKREADVPRVEQKRQGRDLIYERMKMRTGNSKSQVRDPDVPVGGGILEKSLIDFDSLNDGTDLEHLASEGREAAGSTSAAATAMMQLLMSLKSETREMQCCDDIQLMSTGTVLECHPYALGRYRKIGSCGGRSFYQHRNNTDIFLYYACGAWYVGMEVGSCGGWILAKSVELCASAPHQVNWQFYNEGTLQEDSTFVVMEMCKFYDDFRPLPNRPLVISPGGFPTHRPFEESSYPTSVDRHDIYQPNDAWQKLAEAVKQETIKHEHYHYHVDMPGQQRPSTLKGYKPIVSPEATHPRYPGWPNPGSYNEPPPNQPPSGSLDMNSLLNLQNNQLLHEFKQKQETMEQMEGESMEQDLDSIHGEEIQSPNHQSIMINNFHVPTQDPAKASSRPFLLPPVNDYNPPSTTPLRPSVASDLQPQMVSYVVKKKKKPPMEVQITSDAIMLSHHGRQGGQAGLYGIQGRAQEEDKNTRKLD